MYQRFHDVHTIATQRNLGFSLINGVFLEVPIEHNIPFPFLTPAGALTLLGP